MVGGTSFSANQLWPIGTEGLLGLVAPDFVTIAGPCGDAHTMSRKAAAELRDWLTERLPAGLPP